MDVAWYQDPDHPEAPFAEMTDAEIVRSWRGRFREQALATPLPLLGGDTFQSVTDGSNEGHYSGVAWALAGAGAGFFRAGTRYRPLAGPYNPITLLDFAQGQIALHGIEAPSQVKGAIAIASGLIEALRRRH